MGTKKKLMLQVKLSAWIRHSVLSGIGKIKKRFINIKLISTHILYNSFSQKASPKISSEDQQNAILILPTEKSGENNRSSEIPGICNKIPCSQSTGCVVSTSRHHTFKLKVSLMKKTPIQSKSGNVQTKVLYSGETGNQSHKRKRNQELNEEEGTCSRLAPILLAITVPYAHLLSENWKGMGGLSILFNRQIWYATDKGSSRSGTISCNINILEQSLPSLSQ